MIDLMDAIGDVFFAQPVFFLSTAICGVVAAGAVWGGIESKAARRRAAETKRKDEDIARQRET